LLRNEYLAAENQILRGQIKGRLLLSEGEKVALAEIAHRLGRMALEDMAATASYAAQSSGHPGKIQENVKCGVVGCPHPGSKWFTVPEEKRTDVNIAVSMVDDAYQNACDHFVLMSGDSDLVPGLATVRRRFAAKSITVYVPSRNPITAAAVELRAAAQRARELPLLLLAKAQFPNSIPDGAGGTLNRPATWV
jgi:uncharacterized LabA/DUF88 family protein